jgi:hypothetical protein
MCKALSSIGQPLTQQQVISLAQEMILGTKYEEEMLEYKKNEILLVKI